MSEVSARFLRKEKLMKVGQINFAYLTISFLSIILTLSAWYYSKNLSHQKLEIKFNRHADQVINLIKDRMGLYENALLGGVAYVDAIEKEVTYKQWLAYANSLKIDKSYPGINGIGIIYNIKPEKLTKYLEQQREQRPDYKIFPTHEQSEYWPITYVEPSRPNKKAIGLDMAFESNRYLAIQKARDTGTAQLTGAITLVQDSKKTPGFLFYAPFYKIDSTTDSITARRESIIGVTYAPFIMKSLMQGTLDAKNRYVSIKITDADDVLFDDEIGEKSPHIDSNPIFSKHVSINLYGRIWDFSIQSNLNFRNESNANQSIFILIFGLIIDALIVGLFIFLAKSKNVSDRMTKILENKTRELEKSNADLEQFSYLASHDLKSPLNAIRQLAGFITDDCKDIIPDASKEHLSLLSKRTERMIKLLDDLLEYSRVDSKKYQPEMVNLDLMGRDLFKLMQNQNNFKISSQNIDIDLPKIPLEIVLRNLISNAIKHHDKEQGHISINYEKGNGYHLITVEDDGPGIPPEFHKKAMEMFKTLKSRDKVEGSGMGLAMINRIVSYYDSFLIIDSDGIRGTKMIIKWKI
jgi:CHASE1-domain containing sensor protein/anti-sigma regulatory factor (Ser/Thr protein kinase)